MLEEIKEVLISEKQQELHMRQEIDQKIKELMKVRDLKHQQAIQVLSNLEIEMKGLNSKVFNRVFHSKQLQELCTNYTNISDTAIQDIKQLNAQIDNLYQKIHDLSHDEVIIEREIERIRQAASLQELGLDERTALQYIKSDDKKVIRAVFKEIKDSQPLQTSIEIDKNMKELYQSNLSPFVLAMQKISLDNLVKELIDIGIMIDEDKIKFLQDLQDYAKTPNEALCPKIYEQERTDRLDNNFYNQVQEDLANMNRYSSYPSILISKIVTLAVLTSMAKSNKQQIQNQK